ncbi:MAG: hypothetical protein DHS20C16_16290 [Phycisphaerae bacterium]|nr:MAG: hypothetical protein DHS20C16_16290 [Phycisphaerae bacterium]
MVVIAYAIVFIKGDVVWQREFMETEPFKGWAAVETVSPTIRLPSLRQTFGVCSKIPAGGASWGNAEILHERRKSMRNNN